MDETGKGTKLLGVNDVAELLGVTPAMVKAAETRGSNTIVPSRGPRNKRLYTREQVEQLKANIRENHPRHPVWGRLA